MAIVGVTHYKALPRKRVGERIKYQCVEEECLVIMPGTNLEIHAMLAHRSEIMVIDRSEVRYRD